jgi:hypothetical protein
MSQGWRKQMASDTFEPVHIMQKSKIVEVDGIFIGAAVLVSEAEGWRFVAADHRADEANGRVAPTLHEAQQLAKKAFFSSRSPARTHPPLAERTSPSWPGQNEMPLRASA